MKKIGLIYTGTTPELVHCLKTEVQNQLGGLVEICSYEDADILTDIRKHGYVTPFAASKLLLLYLKAVNDGSEAVLNVCSSVGDVVDAAKEIANYIGVPFIRIDEEMCRSALCMGNHIGILATLPTTLTPTKNLIYRMARQMGKYDVILSENLVDAFDLNTEQFKEALVSKALTFPEDTDVILLCQGSMAYCEQIISDVCKKPVVSSPRYGISALKQALILKNIINIKS